jgi:hypothetical protein
LAGFGKTTRRGPFGWLLWWQVDDAIISRQVGQYRTLKIHQSSRGQAFLLLLLAAVLTVLMIEFVSHNRIDYVDVFLFLLVGGFIWRGARWAMIAAMILWTLEKVLQLAGTLSAGKGSMVVGMIVWWAVYMRTFYVAWRVENARRKPAADVAVFD